jgi:hypothetical protein
VSIGTTADWYVIGAWNQYTNDGSGLYCQVYGISASNDVFTFNEGE